MESEGQLALSLLASDPRTSTLAWRHYAPLIRGIVGATFSDSTDVDDVTQDVFLKLVEQLAMARPPGAPLVSVDALVLRIVEGERRRRHTRRWLVLTDTGYISEDKLIAANEEKRIEAGALEGFLDKLPARERNVLLLRHLEGLTLNEISLALRVSLSTAKRAFNRVRRKVLRR